MNDFQNNNMMALKQSVHSFLVVSALAAASFAVVCLFGTIFSS